MNVRLGRYYNVAGYVKDKSKLKSTTSFNDALHT